ncbi:MAG: FKBP-type peptidyl-prolyl cis-trans isomerase [Rubinisphaera brasiliensis]|uniref:FKBP-type peptidyl-prolyl cis-trans isomerase n=1 Tax=Rubinisphaera brasiliensis TaxID=119 RepID=UPI00391D9113
MPSHKGVRYQITSTGTGEAVFGEETSAFFDLEIRLNGGDHVQTVRYQRVNLRDREIIAGIRYGVSGMQAGETRELVIPHHLAYGTAGVPGKIPPEAVLKVTATLTTFE